MGGDTGHRESTVTRAVTSVQLVVLEQVRTVAEGLATLPAHTGLLARLDVLVLAEV